MFTPYPASFLAAQRLKLVEQRVDCRSQLEHLDDPPEKTGDLGDLAEVESQRKQRALTYQRIMKELAEIDLALTKLSRGTYGICEQTQVPISVERLEAIPTARYDVVNQQRRERRLHNLELLRRAQEHAEDDTEEEEAS